MELDIIVLPLFSFYKAKKKKRPQITQIIICLGHTSNKWWNKKFSLPDNKVLNSLTTPFIVFTCFSGNERLETSLRSFLQRNGCIQPSLPFIWEKQAWEKCLVSKSQCCWIRARQVLLFLTEKILLFKKFLSYSVRKLFLRSLSVLKPMFQPRKKITLLPKRNRPTILWLN